VCVQMCSGMCVVVVRCMCVCVCCVPLARSWSINISQEEFSFVCVTMHESVCTVALGFCARRAAVTEAFVQKLNCVVQCVDRQQMSVHPLISFKQNGACEQEPFQLHMCCSFLLPFGGEYAQLRASSLDSHLLKQLLAVTQTQAVTHTNAQSVHTQTCRVYIHKRAVYIHKRAECTYTNVQAVTHTNAQCTYTNVQSVHTQTRRVYIHKRAVYIHKRAGCYTPSGSHSGAPC
jgi:hypothetical protein